MDLKHSEASCITHDLSVSTCSSDLQTRQSCGNILICRVIEANFNIVFDYSRNKNFNRFLAYDNRF